MANVTIRFSALLIAVGLIFFFVTGHAHYTALIPAWFGLALLVLGVAARNDNEKVRMTVMHIAVTVALLGFLFPAIRVAMKWAKAHAVTLGMVEREELLMAIICLLLVALCVRSFIAVRRAREN